MRILFFVLFVLFALTSACKEPPTRPCGLEYEHLIKLGDRRKNLNLKARYINACVNAWDEGKHRCIMDATKASKALECRPEKVHPG
jgi:hypothetical protein